MRSCSWEPKQGVLAKRSKQGQLEPIFTAKWWAEHTLLQIRFICQGDTAYTAKATSLFRVLPPSAVKIQACLVTEIALCLKPRQSLCFWEVTSTSLRNLPKRDIRLVTYSSLERIHPDFKGFNSLPHQELCLYAGTALWCGFTPSYRSNVSSDMRWNGHYLRGSMLQPFKDVFWLRSSRRKASTPAPSQQEQRKWDKAVRARTEEELESGILWQGKYWGILNGSTLAAPRIAEKKESSPELRLFGSWGQEVRPAFCFTTPRNRPQAGVLRALLNWQRSGAAWCACLSGECDLQRN